MPELLGLTSNELREEHTKLKAFFVELMNFACDGEGVENRDIIYTAINFGLAHYEKNGDVKFDLRKESY